MDEKMKNNQATFSGEIISEFEYSHEVLGEKFYTSVLCVKRKSGVPDKIPFIVSERLVDVSEAWTGQIAKLFGQIRSYNKRIGDKLKLVLYVFVREISLLDEREKYDSNNVVIDGYICKEPIYRRTPLGREIADVIFAVNRAYAKTDYVPSVFWGRNAEFINCLDVGTRIKAVGRLQSRDYVKKHEDGAEETKTTYELSVSTFEVVEDENNG